MDDDAHRNTTRKVLSGSDVRTWRVSRELDYSAMGRMLGVTSQSVKKYEHSGMSRTGALALAAIDAGLSPYTPNDEDKRIAQEINTCQDEE